MTRARLGDLPNRSTIGPQREPVPCRPRVPEPAMERLMRWVAWGLVLLGTAAGLWDHWPR
ncbi:hypothetical protein GR328_03475 [Microvirga makkahensis]|uniref:Uncharacterized protein n=1 Tax=Microvirga makkahensis TaxID=1128670 RepID=A0A7X3MP83_9HYPH|nr:hypothetical protein [Microvirga makkahensis]